MKKNVVLCILALLMLVSCVQTEQHNTEVADMEKLSDTISEAPDYAKFGLQSGVLEMESVTMGMTQSIVVYFEDWGRLVKNEIQMTFMGQKTHVVTLIKEGYSYEMDMIQKKGVKKQLDTLAYDQVNYLKLDDEQKKQFNMTYLGEVEILGRTCQEYEMDIKDQGVKAKTAVWNGIALRSEATMMGITVKINVTKIQENVELPEGTFDIPEEIVFEN